jgi:predicted RNase H-like nuclease
VPTVQINRHSAKRLNAGFVTLPLMADSERNEIIFTEFDSAWGARNSGAICELILNEDGSLRLDRDPVIANWDDAIAQAAQTKAVDLHVWAIDQPICVPNNRGCRPVEQDLASALMARFGCGAHSSNLANPCWQPGARIWEFVRALDDNNYPPRSNRHPRREEWPA